MQGQGQVKLQIELFDSDARTWHVATVQGCRRLFDSSLGYKLTIEFRQHGLTLATDLAQLIWRPVAPKVTNDAPAAPAEVTAAAVQSSLPNMAATDHSQAASPAPQPALAAHLCNCCGQHQKEAWRGQCKRCIAIRSRLYQAVRSDASCVWDQATAFRAICAAEPSFWQSPAWTQADARAASQALCGPGCFDAGGMFARDTAALTRAGASTASPCAPRQVACGDHQGEAGTAPWGKQAERSAAARPGEQPNEACAEPAGVRTQPMAAAGRQQNGIFTRSPPPSMPAAAARVATGKVCRMCGLNKAEQGKTRTTYCRVCAIAARRATASLRDMPNCAFARSAVGAAVAAKLLSDAAFFESEAWQQRDSESALRALCGAGCFEPGGCFWDLDGADASQALKATDTPVAADSEPAAVPETAAGPSGCKRSAADLATTSRPAHWAKRALLCRVPGALNERVSWAEHLGHVAQPAAQQQQLPAAATVTQQPTRDSDAPALLASKECRWCSRPHGCRTVRCRQCTQLKGRLYRGFSARGLIWDHETVDAAALACGPGMFCDALWNGAFEFAAKALLGPNCLVPGVRLAAAVKRVRKATARVRGVVNELPDSACDQRMWESAPGVLRVSRIHIYGSTCPCTICSDARERHTAANSARAAAIVARTDSRMAAQAVVAEELSSEARDAAAAQPGAAMHAAGPAVELDDPTGSLPAPQPAPPLASAAGLDAACVQVDSAAGTDMCVRPQAEARAASSAQRVAVQLEAGVAGSVRLEVRVVGVSEGVSDS